MRGSCNKTRCELECRIPRLHVSHKIPEKESQGEGSAQRRPMLWNSRQCSGARQRDPTADVRGNAAPETWRKGFSVSTPDKCPLESVSDSATAAETNNYRGQRAAAHKVFSPECTGATPSTKHGSVFD